MSWPGWGAMLAECALARFVSEGEGLCVWCGAELPRRCKVLCSQDCRDAATANHFWNAARWRMLRGNPTCAVCGRAENELLAQRPSWARGAVLEVDHREPILGRHGEAGCHHHLDGLQVLCTEHHREKTTIDVRRIRGLAPRATQPELESLSSAGRHNRFPTTRVRR